MLVTQSEHGMTLVPRNGEAIHVPAHPVKVRDVSGAGDTVAAVLAVALAAGADWKRRYGPPMRRQRSRLLRKAPPSSHLRNCGEKILPHAFLAAEEKMF